LGCAWSPTAAGLLARALDILTFGPIRSIYPALAAGPLDADLRRGFEIPNNRARFPAHPSDEGWANGGCSDPFEISSRRATDVGHQTMAVSPFKFLQEVRSETAKVTWPTRRETTITTIMVFVMVAVASIFFFAADQIIRYLITFLLGIH
jgi:preprotein translocase subunit SecE